MIITPLVGRKILGFKFNTMPDRIDWAHEMENWIGKVGTITGYYDDNDSYEVQFNSEYNTWHYPAELVEQYLINTEIMREKNTITVSKSNLKRIHSVACETWKKTIETFANRDIFSDSVEIYQEEIDTMFGAATTSQRPVLVDIFGEPKKKIEWDRIKTGSKVMLQYTGQHCSGIHEINSRIPVDVVFFNAYPIITGSGKFEVSTRLCCTFHQAGKFVLFAADVDMDYIVEVIEY